MKIKELMEEYSVDDLLTKVRTGNYRIASAIGSKKYALERKRPSTGEWLIGVNVNANSAKQAILQLKHEGGKHMEYWYAR